MGDEDTAIDPEGSSASGRWPWMCAHVLRSSVGGVGTGTGVDVICGGRRRSGKRKRHEKVRGWCTNLDTILRCINRPDIWEWEGQTLFRRVEAGTKDHHPGSCPNGISMPFESRGEEPVPDTLRSSRSYMRVPSASMNLRLSSWIAASGSGRSLYCGSHNHNFVHRIHRANASGRDRVPSER